MPRRGVRKRKLTNKENASAPPKKKNRRGKPSMSRAWTKTNPDTGTKEDRLHRKSTKEVKKDERAQKKQQKKASLKRVWTKTNPKSGKKENRLHRKKPKGIAKWKRDKDGRLHRI